MITQECPRDVVICGNFKTTSFGIAQTDKMFSMLSKRVYTNRVQAVIREYCCNASDAHVAADQNAQFKVHLPNILESWFSVRDFGNGMSDEDIRGVFCIYGYSTKDQSNDFTGCLGIGAKAAFSLVDSFTVTSYYGGMKTVYNCYIDTVGTPQIARLTQEDSDEPTGLEVKMAVNGRSEEFKREAIRVFQYFDVQPIINLREVVDAVAKAKSSYEIVHPQFSVSKRSGTLLALMGNVAYKIPSDDDDIDDEETERITNLPSIEGFLRFEIGELDFDPGREELSLDPVTVAAVHAKIELLRSEIQGLVEAEIEQQPTFYKKCVAYEKLNAGAIGDLIRLKDRYKLPEATTKFTVYEKATYRKTVSKSEETECVIEEKNRVFFKAPRFEARIRQWLKTLGSGRVILLDNNQIDELQIDRDIIQTLDAVVPQLDKAARGPRAVNLKTFVWNGDTSRTTSNRSSRSNDWDSVTVDVADTTEEKVYVELNDWKIENVIYWLNSTAEIQTMTYQCRKYGVETPQVYGLKTSILKTQAFKKGNWIKLEDYIRREIAIHAPKIVYHYNGSNQGLFKELAKIVRIPEVDGLIQMLDGIAKANYNEAFWNKLGITLDFDTTPDTMEAQVFAKYPMLQFASDEDIRKNPATIKEYVESCPSS